MKDTVLVCLLTRELGELRMKRPSRHCVTRIAQQQGHLKEKGLIVVAISTSSLLWQSIKKWRNEQDIRFTVGEITGDIEQTKTTWGIRSLPWLILTDGHHIVRAEGFRLDELDGMLAQIIEVQK